MKALRRWIIARAIRAELQDSARMRVGMRRAAEKAQQAIHDHIQRMAGQYTTPALSAAHTPPGWHPPFPVDAQHAPWERLHRFLPGVTPQRNDYGIAGEHPVSLTCPMCEAENPPMTMIGAHRTCVYCGAIFHMHGLRIVWWREPSTVTVEWGQG